ncbi:MAG: phospho-N-acetylmuramoyl-pentapeptide-transferase [Campylobacterales bacterium]|nr:phospho-N-acetylmuramoyl-pentapeptide-transferase [Campylobacterales bacterium]
MLYALYELFNINILQYISVRAGFGFFIAFLMTIYIMPRFMAWAIARKAQQPINKYVPNHASKQNTPTMGGAVFVLSTIIGVLLSSDLTNTYVIAGLITILGFALVGLQDDLGKILTGDNLKGLTSRGKLLLQAIIGIVVSLFLIWMTDFPTTLYLPFFKEPIFDMGYFAIPFWVFVFLATTNAVNLTDGLDGLATVPSIFSLATLGIIIYITGHTVFSGYLLMPNINGVGEITILAATLSGALLGFLWYNCYPAEVFMGDTGSLAIGGVLAYMGIIGKSEALLILIGLIFVIETVSVILQIGSFKLRQKRVFLMAPIHHHFEMKKWAENKIIVRFWMIAFLSNIVALITLKIR